MASLALLGFVLGFALNHGSIYAVIATRELVSEKRPARFIALVECAVWAALVCAVLGTSPTMQQGWSPLGYLVPAAMLFGIGTYVNGGACTFLDGRMVEARERFDLAQLCRPLKSHGHALTLHGARSMR
jgi:hypothetical protein